jgi:hypothetical protein
MRRRSKLVEFEMAPVHDLGELETIPEHAPSRTCLRAADNTSAPLWFPGVFASKLAQPDVVTDLECFAFHAVSLWTAVSLVCHWCSLSALLCLVR